MPDGALVPRLLATWLPESQRRVIRSAFENRNCWVVGEFTSCPLGELSSCLCCVEVPHLGLLPSMCVG